MNVYYKYYSALPPEYFINPTIKISQPYLFNDPFEQFLSQDAVDAILKEFKENEPPEEMTDELVESLIRTFQRWSSGTGVVSLSETHRNKLMWSHYANSHRGLCIGYKKDFLSSLPPHKSKLDTSKYVPVKVNYDSCRFDIDRYEREQPTFIDIASSSLFTKSDDWIYEKEHRCIISFAWADKVIIRGNVTSVSPDFHSWMFSDESIKAKVENEFNGKTETIVSFRDERKYLYASLSEESNALILKNIKPSSITEVYFGCLANSEYINSIVKTIRENKELLGHIKIYQYETSKTKFELISKRIEI